MHLLGQVDDLCLFLVRVLGVALQPGVLDVLLEPLSPQGGEDCEEVEAVDFTLAFLQVWQVGSHLWILEGLRLQVDVGQLLVAGHLQVLRLGSSEELLASSQDVLEEVLVVAVLLREEKLA